MPRVVIGGSGSGQDGSQNNLMQGLLAILLSDRMGVQLNTADNSVRSPQVEALRNQIYASLATSQQDVSAGQGQPPTMSS